MSFVFIPILFPLLLTVLYLLSFSLCLLIYVIYRHFQFSLLWLSLFVFVYNKRHLLSFFIISTHLHGMALDQLLLFLVFHVVLPLLTAISIHRVCFIFSVVFCFFCRSLSTALLFIGSVIDVVVYPLYRLFVLSFNKILI